MPPRCRLVGRNRHTAQTSQPDSLHTFAGADILSHQFATILPYGERVVDDRALQLSEARQRCFLTAADRLIAFCACQSETARFLAGLIVDPIRPCSSPSSCYTLAEKLPGERTSATQSIYSSSLPFLFLPQCHTTFFYCIEHSYSAWQTTYK